MIQNTMNELGYWLLRYENQLLATIDRAGGNIFPRGRATDFGSPRNVLLVGEWRGIFCYAAELDRLPENIPGELMPVRSLFSLAGEEEIYLAGRAVQLLDWQKNHRYCGKCGAPTTIKAGQFAMLCHACGLVAYPRISPAVMVLIQRGDELLLARSPRFRPGVFSALAGFVEAGETLEQCASREVLEEVGITITNLRYFGSQSWPFPHSLMVAFFADYTGGIIKPEPSEIEDARWFSCSALPALPEPVSIARQMIDAACR
ncbi:MAG: NUDIX hydrolase [Candidatus Gallionella acididurans]|uniref:NAD(+) diphosphatase n=1 Tax=Candidatus Gallionella acididurans TaxID=1796491 RepID=A0A139BW21_9PROT|nr:MAG: NUDIX hydrolase [Candidatus Gallionella acididurans]